jgi:hypothetical protein
MGMSFFTCNFYRSVIASAALAFAFSACTDSDSGLGANSEDPAGDSAKCKDVSDEAFCDLRDGQVYRTVEIDSMVWTAQNMNYYMVGSHCYDDKDSNCTKYGKLYSKSTIFHICKNGWHVPSKDEYEKLLKYLNRHQDYVRVFKPLSAGFRKTDGTYSLIEEKAYFWSSTEVIGQGECYVEFSDENPAGKLICGGMERGDALSLRCVKDD